MARVIGIAYDDRNQTGDSTRRMVQPADLDNSQIRRGERGAHRYHYDRRVAVATCFGRRVAKVVDHQNGGMATRFVYGGQASWQVLAEFDGFQPWDTAPLATYVFGNYIDEPIQMRRDLDGPSGGQQSQDFYYHPDELFSVVAITDAGGAVVERVRYGDYGMPSVTDASGAYLSDASTIGNPFLFTGREYEPEIRFFYYRTRYMESGLGRFTTRDVIGTWADTTNLGSSIAHVASAPMRVVDPIGTAGQTNPFHMVPKEDLDHFVPWFHHDYVPDDPSDVISPPGRSNPDHNIRKALDEWYKLGKPKSGKPRGFKKRGGGASGAGWGIIITATAILADSPELLRAGPCREYFDRLNKAAQSGECDPGILDTWGGPCSEEVLDRLGVESWGLFEDLREAARENCNSCP